MPRGFAEIALCRRIDAIASGAEINSVEIECEDFVLAEFALQAKGQKQFLNFALKRFCGSEKGDFSQLLGDGAAAFAQAPRRDVAP